MGKTRLNVKGHPIVNFFIVLLFLLFSPQMGNSTQLGPAEETAVTWINGAAETYKEIAEYIWDHPELSLDEYKSSAKLIEYLEKNGFNVEKVVLPLAGNGGQTGVGGLDGDVVDPRTQFDVEVFQVAVGDAAGHGNAGNDHIVPHAQTVQPIRLQRGRVVR